MISSKWWRAAAATTHC